MLRAGWIQGEGSIVSGVQKKLQPLFLAAYDTLTIFEKGLEMRKLQPPKVKGVKNSKKQTTEHYQSQFLNTQKKSLYVAALLLEFIDDL